MSESQTQKIPRSQSTIVNDSQNKRVRTQTTVQERSEEVILESQIRPNQHCEQTINYDSGSDLSDENDYETSDENEKKVSKCWQHFVKRKLKKEKIGKKGKNGKVKPGKIVICQVATPKGICKKVIAHNDNSTGKMGRHLKSKHDISLLRKMIKKMKKIRFFTC